MNDSQHLLLNIKKSRLKLVILFFAIPMLFLWFWECGSESKTDHQTIQPESEVPSYPLPKRDQNYRFIPPDHFEYLVNTKEASQRIATRLHGGEASIQISCIERCEPDYIVGMRLKDDTVVEGFDSKISRNDIACYFCYKDPSTLSKPIPKKEKLNEARPFLRNETS
jgi:hypothetical protein